MKKDKRSQRWCEKALFTVKYVHCMRTHKELCTFQVPWHRIHFDTFLLFVCSLSQIIVDVPIKMCELIRIEIFLCFHFQTKLVQVTHEAFRVSHPNWCWTPLKLNSEFWCLTGTWKNDESLRCGCRKLVLNLDNQREPVWQRDLENELCLLHGLNLSHGLLL